MKKNILIISSIIFIIILICSFYFFQFLKALRSAEIEISKTELKSNKGFLNPITIESLTVDSIGNKGFPVKYTINHLTTISINQVSGRPPKSIKKINLYKPGNYSWTEENTNIPMEHYEISRNRLDSIEGIIWSDGLTTTNICPIKFQKNSWYFIDIMDPQIIGIYVYSDSVGNITTFNIYSGVSPI